MSRINTASFVKYDYMEVKFGKRLAELRKSFYWSQQDLAEMLNVHRGTISNWEDGKRECSFLMLMEIAKIMECSVDYLIGYVD